MQSKTRVELRALLVFELSTCQNVIVGALRCQRSGLIYQGKACHLSWCDRCDKNPVVTKYKMISHIVTLPLISLLLHSTPDSAMTNESILR